MASLRHIWNSKKLKVGNKLRILTTRVFNVLLYTSEALALKEANRNKIMAFEFRNEILLTDSKN